MQSSSWTYRDDIDGLRALAVAIVILFHFEVSWIPGGFVGVDVFFVISGFLITSLIARQIAEGRFSLIDFYERRFRRIYPNLLIVMLVTAVLGFVTMVPLTYRAFGRSLIWATLSASNFVFIDGNGYFDPGNLTKPLLHTWSLGVEEQFYLVFPWLLILAAKRGYSTKWLIGVVAGLSLVLSIGAAFVNWAPAYFLLPTRFWELGIGALVAIAPQGNRLTQVQRSAMGIAGLLAIAWAALRLSEADPFPGYLALAPTLGAAAVIWANGGLASRLLALRPFVWIGRLSFALYLWHWPLISLASGIGLAPTDTVSRLALTGIMLALSVAGYFLWEQPIRKRRMLARRKLFFTVLATFSIVLIGIGAAIFQTKGVPQRLPKEIAAMDAITKKDSYFIGKRCPDLKMLASCPLGDETADKVSFVIIGDSHSTAVAAEIGDIAKAYHLKGLYLGRGGCPPLSGITREENSSCPLQYEFAVDQIRENDPDLVIAILQWTSLVGGPTGNFNPSLFENGKKIEDPERVSVVQNAIERTLNDIGTRKFVTSITVPQYEGRETVTWRLWAKRHGLSGSAADQTYDDYLKQQSYVIGLLQSEKDKHADFDYVNPGKPLCPQGKCDRATPDAILYQDNTHLSHAGALLYAPLFQPYLAALAKQSQPGPAANAP